MKKIFYYLAVFFLLSCGNAAEKTYEYATLKDVTTNDKKFIFETANGEKVECFLNYIIESKNNKPINDKVLRYVIKTSNEHIKDEILLPSSFKPLEYNIKHYDSKLFIKVSFEAENKKRKMVLYKFIFDYELKSEIFSEDYKNRRQL